MDRENSGLGESLDTGGSADTFATALEARTASSINSTPKFLDINEDAASTPVYNERSDIYTLPSSPVNSRQVQGAPDHHIHHHPDSTLPPTTLPQHQQIESSDDEDDEPIVPILLPRQELDHPQTQHDNNNNKTINSNAENFPSQQHDPNKHEEEEQQQQPLGASLFSVPPSHTPTTGVYSMPVEAFQFKDLDSGRTFYMDKRYWIKDVDSGKVYVVQPDETNSSTSSPNTKKKNNNNKQDATMNTPSSINNKKVHRKESKNASDDDDVRISDLLSGQELTLAEFEQTLGYFREAPYKDPSGYSHHGSGVHSDADSDEESDMIMTAQHMAQKGMQSLKLAAAVSSSWIKEKTAIAIDKINHSLQQQHQDQSKSSTMPMHQQQYFERSSMQSFDPGETSPGSMQAKLEDGHGRPVKVNVARKNFKEYTDVRLVQVIPAHQGVVWTMKFNKNGKYLASAGQDCSIIVWETILDRTTHAKTTTKGGIGIGGDSNTSTSPTSSSPHKDRVHSGIDFDGDYSNRGNTMNTTTTTTTNNNNNNNMSTSDTEESKNIPHADTSTGTDQIHSEAASLDETVLPHSTTEYGIPVLQSRQPYRIYRGHKQDVLDIAWSRTNFLLSASMDKTVRLWHVSMDECLRVFKHTDFVTAIDFHPSDDKLFVSGSIDGKFRLWNIPEQRVMSWQDVHDMITAVGFSKDGQRAVVGSMRGKCRFYGTAKDGATASTSSSSSSSYSTISSLEYQAQVDVKNKRGQHARGKKVTGIHFAPARSIIASNQYHHHHNQCLLITSNDSRIRLYDGYALKAKYKGHANKSTQIKASFSPQGDYVICGSDDGYIYIWNTKKATLPGGGSSPDRTFTTSTSQQQRKSSRDVSPTKQMRNSSNSDAKNDSATKEKNASFESFQSSSDVVTVALFAPECCHRSLEGMSPSSMSGGGGVGGARGQVIVTAGYSGEIKIYENVGLPEWL